MGNEINFVLAIFLIKKGVRFEACYCSDFFSFWRILKNKGRFGWKPVNLEFVKNKKKSEH